MDRVTATTRNAGTAASEATPARSDVSGEKLQCVVCGAQYPVGPLFFGCPRCLERGVASPLDFRAPLDEGRLEAFRTAYAAPIAHGVWRYGAVLPSVESPLSLDEGGTPLTLLPGLSRDLGIRLYVKNETMNPTWSFKDRYAAVAVSMARELGFDRVVCASTGNFGQAVAAYSAIAGIRCLVLCPPSASELLRRVMRAHGADVVTMPKGPRGALLTELVRGYGWCPVTSADPDPVANPYGTAGYKTIGHEVARQLEEVPHSVLVPVGAGDCLYGVWRGLCEAHEAGLIGRRPRMVGCQTQDAAPLVHALEGGLSDIERVPEGESSAVSIVEGHCGVYALQAVRASSGTAVAVNDDQIVGAIRLVAGQGLFLEAASAATLAVALALHRAGWFPPEAPVVCVTTSTGLKWPTMVERIADTGHVLKSGGADALSALMPL